MKKTPLQQLLDLLEASLEGKDPGELQFIKSRIKILLPTERIHILHAYAAGLEAGAEFINGDNEPEPDPKDYFRKTYQVQ